MLASYRERVYAGHRCLPPKVESAKSYARLRLDAAAPRWTTRVSQHLRLRVRFWGQQEPSVQQVPAEGLASWEYDIMVPLERLWTYLLDMRILKLQFEDARNRKTVAVGLLNLQMYPMAGSVLDVEATVQIHSIREKCKYGEMEVRLQVIGSGEEQGMPSHNLPPAVQAPKFSEVKFGLAEEGASVVNIAPGSGVKPHSSHDLLVKPAHGQQNTIENRPPEQLKPRHINNHLTQPVREECWCVPHRTHNFQAEIERLRLDELQLLNSQQLVDEQNPRWLSLQIDRCERLAGRLSEQSEYRLMVQFPVMVGNALKMNVFDLACTKATGQELTFGQHIQVSTVQAGSDEQTMRQYLAEHCKFTLSERTANGNSRSIAQGLSRLSEVVGSLRSTGHLLVQLYQPAAAKKESKQGAPVDYILYFKAQNWSQRGQPVTPQQPRVEPKEVPKQKPDARHSMICVRLGKFHNLHPEAYKDNNHMLRVKMAGQIFVSSTVWNEASPDFNFSLMSPLVPEVNGIVVELWNRGTNGLLLGIGKLDISYRMLLSQAGSCGTSIYPAVVFQDELLVSTLRAAPVGYLSAAVLVGNVQQINRFLRAHPAPKKEVTAPVDAPIDSVKPSELKQEETGLPHPQVPADEKPTILKEAIEPLPVDANKGLGEVLGDVGHQIEADDSLLIGLLNEFFGMLSRGDTRRKLAGALQGRVNTSINEFRDMVKKELGLPLAEWAIGKLSYFFVENVRVQVPRLLSSLQSHQFYTDTLLEEYTAVVKELRDAMEYNSLRVNQLEIQLAGQADRLAISHQNFSTVISELLPEFHAASLELLLKLCGKDGVVLYGEFCDVLRKYDVHGRVVQTRMDPMLLLQLVGQELSEVLLAQQSNLQELTRTPLPDRIDYRGLSRLFEQTGILVSYWEALNVIEYLKKEFGDDSEPQGEVSGKLVAKWLAALLSEPETRMVRSPTFGDNLFQPLPQLKPVNQQSEQGSILPALVSLDEHSAGEVLPSPISIPPLQIRLNFTADIAKLTINQKDIQFFISSPRLLFVKHKREAYYDLRLALLNGEELYAEGLHGEWLAVTNMEANYKGALLLT